MNFGTFDDPVDFEWDSFNQTKIRLRHDIATDEAEQSFFNFCIVRQDEYHSEVEQRYQLLGISNLGRVLFIVFTSRNNKIRIISARSASNKERELYVKQA